MRQGTRNHMAGERHGVKGKVKEAARHVTTISDSAATGKVKSQARKTQRSARQATAKLDGAAAASRRIRLVASDTLRRPANMVARFEACGKALLSSFVRLIERLFSYVGDGIRAISSVRLYKQRRLQAA